VHAQLNYKRLDTVRCINLLTFLIVHKNSSLIPVLFRFLWWQPISLRFRTTDYLNNDYQYRTVEFQLGLQYRVYDYSLSYSPTSPHSPRLVPG